MATALSSLVSTGLSTGNSTSGSSSSYPGLGQGINVQAFVTAAQAGTQANISNVQNEQTGVAADSAALAAITSNLTSLQTAATALQDPLGVLASETATSSNSDDLTGTATFSAVPGTHTISITSLATTSSYYSDPVATSSTPLATGDTLAISVGGKQQASITVNSSNNTLAEIAAAINNETSAVQASVITDANGARLAIVSATSGVVGSIGITGTLHDTNGDVINLNQASGGANAVLSVDGVPISSSSNTVSGVISGVTLNLGGPTGGTPVSLTVRPDTSSITSAINTFVTAYNQALTNLDSQFQLGSNGTAEPLEADSSLSDAQSQLLSAASYSVNGTGGPVSLATLGITTNDDGTLSVDAGTLASALASNYSGVQSFFQTTSTGFADNIGNVLNNLVGGNGELTLDAQGYTSQTNDLTQQISDLQAALAVQTTNLTATYAQVNDTLEELPLLQSQLSQQLLSVP